MDFLNLMLNEPEEAAAHMQLQYVPTEKLQIERIKKGKKFLYILNQKPLSKQEDLDRIKKLVIPPAWENVKIATWANAHLQAVGLDVKARKQYKYHTVWIKIRNRTKFLKMAKFGDALPKIRKKVEQDLELEGWPKDKVLALIVKLLEETHIRIGNEQYAKRNKTYGLSTLRTKHVKATKSKIRFAFTGKKGKKHNITLNNKRLTRLVLQCEEIPGWELFQFYDEDGNKMGVDSGMVNQYLHDISGSMFTAKDFRTWSGTVIFFDSLRHMPITYDEKEIAKNMLEAYDDTAKALGNTRNVSRKYYVHPMVAKSYENKELFTIFKAVDDKQDTEYQTAVELTLLKLIKNFEPIIKK